MLRSSQQVPRTKPHGNADQHQCQGRPHRPADKGLPRARLGVAPGTQQFAQLAQILLRAGVGQDRKSVVEGKSVSVRVDLGGRRNIKKKLSTNTSTTSKSTMHKHMQQTNRQELTTIPTKQNKHQNR